MSRPRRLLILLLIFLAVAGALWWLARLYLSSEHITAQLASRLQAAYGAPVQLREASIGVRGSSARDVQIFEANASSGDEPWLVIEHAEADIAVWDLIKSSALPSRLTLSGVNIRLRFDQTGHLLTHIPTSGPAMESLPDIKINDAQIIIRQEGRPDFVVTRVHTDVHDQNRQLALTGTVTDPTWGTWTVNGSLDRTTYAGSATVRTQDVHFTRSMLERLPVVPANIWQHVKVEGDTPVDCAIGYDAAGKSLHYRLVLEPHDTKVEVPSIELHADHGRGKIIAQNGIITVADVQARAADGEIKAAGKIDLAHTPSRLDFKLDASNLVLDKLPKSWELPPWGGRLSGHADLQVTLVKGKMRTNGSGQGMITGVRIPGAPESKPILLKLHPTGEGFRFSSQTTRSESGLNAPPMRAAILVVALLAPQEPEEHAFLSPADLANIFGTSVLRGVDALTQAGNKLIGLLPTKRAAQAKAREAPSYLEAQLGLDDVDVAQLVKGLHIPLAFPVAGRISFNVQLAFPVNTPRDLKTYRLHGTVTSRKLTIAAQEVEDTRARVAYADGVLQLEELSGHISAEARTGAGAANAGSFNGTARLQVIPQGDLSARLAVEAIPLQRALGLMPKASDEIEGTFSGHVEARVPAAKLKDMAAWEASGTITANRVQLYGLTVADATIPLRVHRGTITIQEVHGRMAETPIIVSALVRLANPYPFTGNLSVQKGDLSELQRLSANVRPPVLMGGQVDVAADLKGTLNPFALQTSGSGTAANLSVARLKIGTTRFRWQSDANRINVADLQARLYGGELSGRAVLPLRASVAGNADVSVQNLDVGALTKDVPNLPIRLEGRASGRLEGTLSAAEAGRPREFTSKLELQAPELRVQGIPTERLRGSADYHNEALMYQVEGETLGGRFHLDGEVPPAKPTPAEPAPEGHLRIEGVRLGRLADILHAGTGLRSVRGVGNLGVTFRHAGPRREPIGAGRLTLDRVRWGGTELAGSLGGDVVLTEGELRIRNLTGGFAQGQLRAQIVVNLRQINRSWFSLAVDQAEAARLLAPWPALADRVEGPVQARLRGRLGHAWYGSGDITLGRGRVSGIEVVDWHLPLDWAFAPALGSGQVDIRESTGQIASGRVVSQASLTWGTSLQVQGHIRFVGVELRTLVRQMTELSHMGTGQISGHFDFAGNDVRSVDDLTGTLDARLQQTQALQLPVLQQLAPFLVAGQSSTSVFQSGSLRGHLNHGVFRIGQLTFTGTMIQLFIDGTVTLQGRLNLDVTANTGNLGVSPNFVRFLGLRLPAAGPVPSSLLMEASTYFSNRLMNLRVTGTVRSPIVTAKPLSLLTAGALRFFVNRASLPVP